jgi:hypothetical protein
LKERTCDSKEGENEKKLDIEMVCDADMRVKTPEDVLSSHAHPSLIQSFLDNWESKKAMLCYAILQYN